MANRDRRRGNRPRPARRDAEPSTRARLTRIDFGSQEQTAKGTFTIALLAEVSGGDGSEEVQFYLDQAPQGTEVSVDQQGSVGYAQTRTDERTPIRIGTRHQIAARIVKNGEPQGKGISRTIVLPKEMKTSRLAKQAKKAREEIEFRQLERELRELSREPSANAREIKQLRELIDLMRLRKERDDVLRVATPIERAIRNMEAQAGLIEQRRRLRRLASPSLVAQATEREQEELELARLGRETARLHHEIEREFNDRDAERLAGQLKALRLRIEMDGEADELTREARQLTRQVTIAKLRKELADVDRRPPKDIERPVIECIGSGGQYVLSGRVVFKDAAAAAHYPIIVTLAPHLGKGDAIKILTDQDGCFCFEFDFTEKTCDVHVMVGGTCGYEEFFDNLEGPRKRIGGKYNWQLFAAWAVTIALTIIGFAWVGFNGEPERTMLSGLPADLQQNLEMLHPEWQAAEPDFWSGVGSWFRTLYWTLVVLAWLGSLVFTPIAFSDEVRDLTKGLWALFSRHRRAGAEASGQARGSAPLQQGGQRGGDEPPPEVTSFFKGKGPFITAIAVVVFTFFDEWLERRKQKKIRRAAELVANANNGK